MNEKERLKEIITIIKESKIESGITPEKLYQLFSNLGPTFIKIGQIMSSRYDILPKEYCNYLTNLRTNIPPMDFNEVTKILIEEYGNLKEIFLSIEETPLGSASIAQVHKARLITGEEVVIKIQRENIQETMLLDIKLLKKAIKILHLNKLIKVINLNEILDEMYHATQEEINFLIEANHLEEFKENNKNIFYINVPKVYKNLNTKRTLVMEYIDGIKINDKKALLEKHYHLEEISLTLANNYIKQAIDDGFFHADPHPDNILIRNDEIVFIDLGMMGRLSQNNRQLLKECMKAIIKNDIYEVERILLSLSTTNQEIDHQRLRQDIEKVLNKNATTSIKDINIIEFANSILTILKNNCIQLDKNITMLLRGITVLEGTLEEINPNINLLEVLSNKLKEESLKELLSQEKVIKVGKNLLEEGTSLTKIPTQVLNLVTSLNRGETKIGLEMTNSNKQIDKLEKMLHQLIIGILDASLLLGASLVNNILLRNIYLTLSFVATTWLLITMYIDHIHKGM